MEKQEIFNTEENIWSEDENDLVQDVSLFDQAVIWWTDWTAETIDTQLKRENIDLFPKFQRRDAWSNRDKSKFIESLILWLPIPQIILAEKKKSKWKYIVIDWKQRLLTIRKFFSDSFNDFKPLKLSWLEILKELNWLSYDKISSNPKFSGYMNQLENQAIRTVVIKNWPDESFLYTVFLRLNTWSKQLSPQELRQALHPGSFIDFADDFSVNSEQIMEMLNLKSPDIRMRDVELVVRYFSFKYYLSFYDWNLKKFFDDTVQKLNDSWQEKETQIVKDAEKLNLAIQFTIDLYWGNKNAFSKWNWSEFQWNFNRAIFDIMVFYFSQDNVIEEAINKKDAIINLFKKLCEEDIDFLTSFEHTTKSIENTFKRLNTWWVNLAEILDIKIDVPSYDSEFHSLSL